MNLPNKISLSRICLIPIFVAVFFLDGILPFAFGIAAIIFAIAACTDFIDGKIARSRGLVTNLGKFLDPIADKVLVATAMILILTMNDSLFALVEGASEWVYLVTAICTCIIMARELIISAFRQIAAVNGIIMAAEKLGKYKAACQDFAIFFLILAGGLAEMVSWAVYMAWFGFALFALATVLTILSGFCYIWKNKQVLKDS